MAIETSVNIDVNVDGTATVKQAAQGFEDLGDAVAKTQREVEALALQYGINDERTQEAIKRAGQYKGQLEQLDQAIDANKGGIDQMFRAVQGVAAGFEIAAGATALFGSESEDLNKILIRVQGAMVFAQGLRDLKEFVPAIKAVNSGFINMIKTLNGVKIALAATGIGAIVAVIGLFGEQIGELFDKLKEKFKGFTDSIGLTKFAARDAIKAQEALVDSLNRELAVMEARGASEAQLFQQRLKIAQEEAKLEQQRLDILSESEEGYAAQQKAALDASNNIIVTKEQENKRLRDLDEERIKKEKDAQEERDKFLKEKSKDYADEAHSLLNQTQKQRLKDLRSWYAQELDLVKGNHEAEGNLFDLFVKKKNKLLKEFREEDKEILLESISDSINAFQNIIKAIDEFNKNANTKIDKDFDNRVEKLKELGYSEEQISKMRDSELQKIDERGRQAFEMEKKLRYAQTLLSTIEGATNAFTTAQKSPITAAVPAYPFIQAAAAAAFGLAQLQQISRTSYESKFTPLTKTGSTNVPSVQVRSSSLPQTQDILSQNRQVYVLEGDITRTQRRVASNQSVSVLGG